MKYQTNDLSQFKFLNNNRDIIEANVCTIMDSIKKHNLLEFRPILVDENMNVYEGQHRLEACRRLKIPIWYEVKQGLEAKDMILLNTQKAWVLGDYLKFHCKNGNENYLKLKSLCEKYKLYPKVGLIMCGSNTYEHNRIFREGEFKFPDAFEYEELINRITTANEVKMFLKEKSMGNMKFIENSIFNRALGIFFNCKSIEKDVFMHKLQYKMNILRSASNVNEYLEMFKMIYNFRNSKPIDVDWD